MLLIAQKCCSELQWVVVSSSELQWVAVSCSELQWVAVSCTCLASINRILLIVVTLFLWLPHLFGCKISTNINKYMYFWIVRQVWFECYRMRRTCCSELQWVAVSCSELQWVAVSCSELQWVAVSCSELRWVVVSCSELQWVVVVVSCSELQWVAFVRQVWLESS